MTEAVAIKQDDKSNRRLLTFVAPAIPLIAVGAVWYFADLGELNSPEKIAEAARSLREDPLAFAYVLLAFVLGSLLFFPVTALMAGTALAFPPVQGFCYAYAGALLGAGITYWTGRLAGGAALDYVSGPRIARFRDELRTHAFRASVIARFLPIGNFSMINVLAGSLRVPFGWFVLGNLVGLAPGVLFLTLFADQLTSAMQTPSKTNLTILTAVVALLLGLGFMLKRWVRRRETSGDAQRDSRS